MTEEINENSELIIRKKARFSDEIPEKNNSIIVTTGNIISHSLLRSNDIIEFHFNDGFNAFGSKGYSPEFTHQLFENEEMISLINVTEDDYKREFKIKIFVDCLTMTVRVYFSSTFKAVEMEKTKELLSIGLPNDTIWFCSTLPTIDNNNVHCDKIFEFNDKSNHSDCNVDIRVGRYISKFHYNSNYYEIYVANANDVGANELLQRGEKMALWSIETADSIDFTDNRWEVFFLYKKCFPSTKSMSPTSTIQYPDLKNDNLKDNNINQKDYFYFCGYMTLFSFHNPLVGTKVRVCQALILPHLQGCGLGKKLLQSIYDNALRRPEVVELTVEDPAPGFSMLRDAVDFEWFISKMGLVDSKNNNNNSNIVIIRQFLGDNNRNNIEFLQEKLKLTTNQLLFILDSLQYISIVEEISSLSVTQDSSNDTRNLQKLLLLSSNEIQSNNTLFPKFRLSVKRKLLNNNKELKSLPKTEMQKELSGLFDEEMTRFDKMKDLSIKLGLLLP
eukprot:gene12824-17194_t